MKIVGITACPTGIAHTYITKKKIIEAAKVCGYPCLADVVLLAVDVKITGEERFKGKPVVRCRTEDVMRNTEGFLKKIEATLKNHR